MSNLSWKKDSIEWGNYGIDKQKSTPIDNPGEEMPYDMDKLRKYSQDDGMHGPEVRKRTLSIMMDRMNGT
jgi:hypothetical protein